MKPQFFSLTQSLPCDLTRVSMLPAGAVFYDQAKGAIRILHQVKCLNDVWMTIQDRASARYCNLIPTRIIQFQPNYHLTLNGRMYVKSLQSILK